jgi:hypothetical protein
MGQNLPGSGEGSNIEDESTYETDTAFHSELIEILDLPKLTMQVIPKAFYEMGDSVG